MKRYVINRIARHKNDLDTSRDYVYTEWESVKHFAEEFLELLPSRTSC